MNTYSTTLPTLYEYSLGFYQREKRLDAPGTELATGLIARGGLPRVFELAVRSVLNKFSITGQGHLYVVFNESNWSVEYELGLMEQKNMPVGQRPSKSPHFNCIESAKVVSDMNLEGIAKEHQRLFGGEIKSSRMGPVIEYAYELSDYCIKTIVRNYKEKSNRLRESRDKQTLAVEVVRIIQGQRLL